MNIVAMNHPETLHRACQTLKAGGVIVYPTETSYGIGCDATNKEAIEKVYAIKKLEQGKPLLVIIADQKMARKYGIFSDTAKILAQKYWPGPLTLIVPTKETVVPPLTTDRIHHTIGMRVSPHTFAQSISRKINKPIVSTSANISGMTPLYAIPEIIKQLQSKKHPIDLIVDAGEIPPKKPSTIVEVRGNSFNIIRQGELQVTTSANNKNGGKTAPV